MSRRKSPSFARVAVSLAVLSLALPLAFAAEPARDTTRPEIVGNELLVKFKLGTPGGEQAAAHQQLGGQVVREIAGLDVKVVNVPSAQLETVLAAYERNPTVEYAEYNGVAYPDAYPNPPSDSLYAKQWNLAKVKASQAWNVNAGAASVAIVDTGVHEQHPDLVGKVVDRANWTWMDSVNRVPNRDATDDRYGHGTHVAGIASALTNNAEGIAGGCPNCTIVVAKVYNDDGSCNYDYLANGILWAVGCELRASQGNCLSPVHSRALNVSIAGTYNSITLQDAISKAWTRGAVVSCAAGNGGNSSKVYPAAHTNCIAVAATDSQDRKASWSNFGSAWVDVAAPGVGIWSSVITSNVYEAWNGTSMATPHLTALAGLLWSTDKYTSPSHVRSHIESNADAISGTGKYWSKGRINDCRALGGAC